MMVEITLTLDDGRKVIVLKGDAANNMTWSAGLVKIIDNGLEFHGFEFRPNVSIAKPRIDLLP
jgi:hypothetical protein